MKIKIILIIISMFLLSGCNVTYNILIDDKNFYEYTTINAIENENYSKEYFWESYNYEYPIYFDEEFMYDDAYSKKEGYSYYEKSYKELNDGYIFGYKATYDKDNILRSRTLKSSFQNYSIGYLSDENNYYISLNNPIIFKEFENIETLSINITFADNIEVIEHNAERVDKNTYIWNIIPNSTVNIKYRINNPSENKPAEKVEKTPTVVQENANLLIMGAFAILFLIIIMVIKIKKRKK